MKTYLALFRGINVGGSHRVSMSDLRTLFEKDGCADVRTYIQSGNVIFRSATADVTRLARQIGAGVSRSHGFEPRVLVLTRTGLERAASANPFPEADKVPTSLHLFFLDGTPAKPDLKSIEAIKTRTERYALKGQVFYLYTPDGFGKSKLAARAERLLGVDATARNWRTVTALLEMANETG